VVPNTNSINGNGNGHYVKTVDTWQDCQALCQAATAPACVAWTWHDSNVGPPYTHECYFDENWAPVGEADHFSGYFGAPPPTLQPNVWAASLAGLGLGSVPGLLLDKVRMTRARFPNNPSPERLGFMPPYVLRADSWTPQQLKRAPDTQVDLPPSELLRNTSTSSFQTYTAGVGGTCDRFQPSAGYWCSNNVQGGGSVIYYVPVAAQFSTTTLPNSPYANPAGGIVQTWRPGHWASVSNCASAHCGALPAPQAPQARACACAHEMARPHSPSFFHFAPPLLTRASGCTWSATRPSMRPRT
jgi:hypothetical protein